MVKVVIFDFDLTLFDSSTIKVLMDKRQWSLVYQNIDKCNFYPNAIDTLERLYNNGIKTAIVSNSPKTYVRKVLSFYNVDIDFIVCYHDVGNHKPHPEGIFKVLDYFSINNKEAIYIGDNDIDYTTAQNANVDFFGVSWGIYSRQVKMISYQTLFRNPKK
ncbi:MAG: HAD family hydrolase [Sulfurospirillaceae bacterium]|nr:HAD family hydrolase [Sulfurospirillaceae bacterium]MDD2827443.1 HAD family hydrolase [Sulfurospirillaceae bacterium]